MKDNNLLAIKDALTNSRPPHSIELFHDISRVDWNSVIDGDIETCLDIILIVNANIILCAFDIHGDDRIKYKKLFERIAENIRKSTISSRSSEFSDFFSKYNEYMRNM